MKKLITKEQQDKKTQRNQLIIGGILILVMLSSTLGYAFGNNKNTEIKKIRYHKIDFIKENGYWKFNKNNNIFFTKYNPLDVKNISYSYINVNNFLEKPLYYVGGSEEALDEIKHNFGRFVRISGACLDEKCDEDYPIKNCSKNNIIIFKEGNDSGNIVQNENCVIISSNLENQTIYTDYLVFKIIGI